MTIAHNNPGIVYSPGNWHINATRALSQNSGAYFKTMLSGGPTAITLNFEAGTAGVRVAYRIDRMGGWIESAWAASITVPLPANAATWTKHLLEFVIISTSESAGRWAATPQTAVRFTGITTTPTNVTASAPIRPPMVGMAFGDSITEGINTITTEGDNTVRTNGTLSYAFLVGEFLGAEIGQVGFGRQGLTVDGNGGVPVFGLAWPYQSEGLARVFPADLDFVLINHGQNDSNQPAATVQAEYTAVLNALLTALPSATRIIVMFPFSGVHGAATYQAAIAACSYPARVFFLDTTGWNVETSDGVHPSGFGNLGRTGALTANAIRALLELPISGPPPGGGSSDTKILIDGVWQPI